MDSFEITEEQLNNLEEVVASHLYDENDPRSINYKRKIVRPKINWLLLVLFILVPAGLSVGLWFLLQSFNIDLWIKIISVVVLNLLYIIIFLKKIVITCVKLYQFFAPESVRLRCRFEPSCSEYMILAIEKYGLFKGLKKGINRLKRCNVNGGGYDYP